MPGRAYAWQVFGFAGLAAYVQPHLSAVARAYSDLSTGSDATLASRAPKALLLVG